MQRCTWATSSWEVTATYATAMLETTVSHFDPPVENGHFDLLMETGPSHCGPAVETRISLFGLVI